jgi:putative transcriptional regulator
MRPSLAVYALALVLAAEAAWCEPLAPAAGRFLVADHGLEDRNFSRTVVLLVAYDGTGAMGLIVNRPSQVSLQEAMPEQDFRDDVPRALYFGGPVLTGGMMVLIRSDTPPEDAALVVDDVYISEGSAVLARIATEALDPDRVRVFAGYAGWGPAQLDNEIARGDWLVRPASGAEVFTADGERLWERVAPPRAPLTAGLDSGRLAAARQPRASAIQSSKPSP